MTYIPFSLPLKNNGHVRVVLPRPSFPLWGRVWQVGFRLSPSRRRHRCGSYRRVTRGVPPVGVRGPLQDITPGSGTGSGTTVQGRTGVSGPDSDDRRPPRNTPLLHPPTHPLFDSVLLFSPFDLGFFPRTTPPSAPGEGEVSGE